MLVGASVSGTRDEQAPSRANAAWVWGNMYWDHIDRRTFADMYYGHGQDARAALLFKNAMAARIAVRLPESVRGVFVGASSGVLAQLATTVHAKSSHRPILRNLRYETMA